MTSYLLDTTVLIDFSKGWEPVTSQVHSLVENGDRLGVCAINVAEFYSGAMTGDMPETDAFLRAVDLWPITFETAEHAGELRRSFARRGRALTIADTIIASVCLRQGATLITANVKDFQIDGLPVFPLRPER